MKNHEFRSFTEIELCELHSPGTFKTDAAANAAARKYLEAQLSHAKDMLAITKKATPGSIAFNSGAECEAKIATIEKWLMENPAI